MLHRWGFGPVFAFEWLIASRRWQMYAMRSAFVGLMLCALTVVWKEFDESIWPGLSQQQLLAKLGEQIFSTLIGVELTLILLAAPAATAGAICLDKARGSLLHIFLTDLSDVEVVLGKLAARLVPVLGLLLCSIPIMFICTLMGGIDPEALAGAFLVMLAVAVLGCSLALTLSVWGTKTYEVLVATYLAWILLMLAYPLWNLSGRLLGTIPAAPDWLRNANPYSLAFAPYTRPGSVAAADYLIIVGAFLVVSALLVLLAVARVRRVVIRQASRAAGTRATKIAVRRRGLLFRGPSLDANPVLWREWRRRRPSSWSRWIWGAYVLLALGFSVLAVAEALSKGGFRDLTSIVVTLQSVAGLLLLSAAAPGPLSEERAHGTLDVLLTTPLRTRTLLWAKWRATYRTVLRLAVIPFATLILAAIVRDVGRFAGPVEALLFFPSQRLIGIVVLLVLFLSYGAAFTSLGLALATWTARAGRAVACSVGTYVLVVIGWPMLTMLFFRHIPIDTEKAVIGSPFGGMVVFSETIEFNRDYTWRAEIMLAGLAWITIYFSVAVFFFVAALSTFDRCLGRMRDRQLPRYARRQPRHASTRAEPLPEPTAIRSN